MPNSAVVVSRVLAVSLLLAAAAAAQTTTSTIEGTVTDASGAVIPGAEVTVRGETLGRRAPRHHRRARRLSPDGAAGRDLHGRRSPSPASPPTPPRSR